MNSRDFSPPAFTPALLARGSFGAVLAAARAFELEEFDLLHIVDFGGVAFSVLAVIHPHEYHMLGDETTSTYTNAPEGTQSSSTNMYRMCV